MFEIDIIKNIRKKWKLMAAWKITRLWIRDVLSAITRILILAI